MDYKDIVKKKRDEKRQKAQDEIRRKQLMTVISSGNKKVADSVKDNKTETVTVTNLPDNAKPEDIQKVVEALNDIIVSQTVTTDDLNESFKDIAAGMLVLSDEIEKLPKEYDNQDVVGSIKELVKSMKSLPKQKNDDQNFNQVVAELQNVAKLVSQLQLNPNIEVSSPEVDVKVPEFNVEPIVEAIKAIKVETPESVINFDTDDLAKRMADIKKAIDSQTFPVPNYVLPYSQDGKGSQVQIDSDGNIPMSIKKPRTLFGAVETSSRTPLIELKSNYGISELRDITTVDNSATITNDNTEYNLSTGTTTGSTAIFDSAERGRYIPGSQAQMGIGVRIDETFTGTAYAQWGYYDDDDGFGFGKDANGIYVFTRRAGTDTKVHQADWNLDKLDGSGPSGITLDPADGEIYQIDFSWYGYGAIRFSSVLVGDDMLQDTIDVHTFTPVGETSVRDPNLPIRAEISNGNTTTDYDLYVGGRQYSVYNTYSPNVRLTAQYKLNQGSIDTTFLPVISIRRKVSGSFDSVSVKLAQLEMVVDADMLYQVRLNGSLTGASFGTPTDHSASETAIETDTSATAITGGEVVYQGIVPATGSGSNSLGSTNETFLPLDLPVGKPFTLCVRRFTGTGGTVNANMSVREEW